MVFCLILLLLGGIMIRFLSQMQWIRGMAADYMAEPGRYIQGLRPEDLIHLGSFIQEWIPPGP